MSQHQEGGNSHGGVITPEAVLLDFEIAGLGSRTAALWIDYAIRIVALIIVSFAGAVFEGAAGGVFPSWVGTTVMIFAVFGVLVLYPLIFEATMGRTPGKMVLGLRVVTAEGAPIDVRQAAIRAATSLFEVFATSGLVAATSMVLTQRSQRLGDLAAGTIVLRQRQASKTPEATVFVPPAGAEDYALSLDVSVLSGQEYDAIRSYLIRAPHLSAQSRDQVSQSLAARFVSTLSTQPPQGLSSDGFLKCVAAAYQRRFSTPS